MRGLLVCLEGIDGSGKDTHVTMLFDYFRQKNVAVNTFRFPDYSGPLAGCLLHSLQDTAFNPFARQLLFAAERLRRKDELLEALRNNRLVLTSRYKLSSYVYSVANDLPREWARNLETPLPEPDITFLLDLDVKESMRRTKGGDLIEMNFGWLNNCREEYLQIASKNSDWVVIDARLSLPEISATIAQQIELLLMNL